MRMSVANILAVAVGGSVGAVVRYLVGLQIVRHLPPAYALGTLFVNVTGSLLLGALATLAVERQIISRPAFALLGAGFCGSYTTFSTFSYETLRFASEANWGGASLNVVASVGGSLLGCAIGVLIARSL